MDYDRYFDQALTNLHEEGRYRVFLDIRRKMGAFPKADWFLPDGSQREITVWCGNDYLGMGQHPEVTKRYHQVVDDAGAGSGGTRNISGTTIYHRELEHELANWHQKPAALIFSSAYIANEATLSTLAKLLPDLVIFLDMDVDVGLARTFDAGGDKFEQRDTLFHHAVYDGYQQLLERELTKERMRSVDANGNTDDVMKRILACLDEGL